MSNSKLNVTQRVSSNNNVREDDLDFVHLNAKMFTSTSWITPKLYLLLVITLEALLLSRIYLSRIQIRNHLHHIYAWSHHCMEHCNLLIFQTDHNLNHHSDIHDHQPFPHKCNLQYGTSAITTSGGLSQDFAKSGQNRVTSKNQVQAGSSHSTACNITVAKFN